MVSVDVKQQVLVVLVTILVIRTNNSSSSRSLKKDVTVFPMLSGTGSVFCAGARWLSFLNAKMEARTVKGNNHSNTRLCKIARKEISSSQ